MFPPVSQGSTVYDMLERIHSPTRSPCFKTFEGKMVVTDRIMNSVRSAPAGGIKLRCKSVIQTVNMEGLKKKP